MKIESLQNNKVKEWNKLKEKKIRDQRNEFLIEGDHLLKEAFNQHIIKEVIALDPTFEISGIPFYEVNEMIMKKLSNQPSIPRVIAVCSKIKPREIKGNVCLLDNLQDPGNLGTILRSAVAFGIDTVIMSKDTVDLYNEKVIRASEGMIFHLNVLKEDLEISISKLQKLGYTIYGTDVKKGVNLKEIHFPLKSGIIIGNEGSGMNAKYQKYCSELLHIPQTPECESLNAGVATSIIFYEMYNE